RLQAADSREWRGVALAHPELVEQHVPERVVLVVADPPAEHRHRARVVQRHGARSTSSWSTRLQSSPAAAGSRACSAAAWAICASMRRLQNSATLRLSG